jgi:prophage regulatory protein
MDTDKVVRRKQLLELIGVSAATQWRMEKAGLFPPRFRLGKGSVGWHLKEVEEWLRNREPVTRQPVERKIMRRAADRCLVAGGQAVLTERDQAAAPVRSVFCGDEVKETG